MILPAAGTGGEVYQHGVRRSLVPCRILHELRLVGGIRIVGFAPYQYASFHHQRLIRQESSESLRCAETEYTSLCILTGFLLPIISPICHGYYAKSQGELLQALAIYGGEIMPLTPMKMVSPLP